MATDVANDVRRGALPRHVAIIMDGNGRWARAQARPRSVGHTAGVEALREIVHGAVDLDLEYLTFFGFSTENWKRPAEEVSFLMGLLRRYLKREVAGLHERGVRLRFIGARARFDSDIRALIDGAEVLTAENGGLNVTIALNYGGREEIVLAAQRLAAAVAAGELSVEKIDESRFQAALFTCDLPAPDLLIRTSGEQRLSNFLLWQSAYTEFVFTDVLWPDFGRAELAAALEDYQARDRRFGTVG